MKIEKHNAHGMQLLVSLSPKEVWQLIKKLAQTNNMVAQADVSHYVTIACEFEDDNDRWVPTDFTIVVVGNPAKSEEVGCQSAYPCGKPVEVQDSIPAGPCDLQEGHDANCYRCNARPVY